MEYRQIAHEDALELGRVAAAVGLAIVVDDAVGVGEVVDGGIGNVLSQRDVVLIRHCKEQLDQAAEDDALVVRPRVEQVVLAVGVQPVVDGVVLVDHARGLEPGELALRPADIEVFVGSAVGQVRRHRKEEFVRDGVGVGAVLGPPDAAIGAVGRPSGRHAVEDALGEAEVLLVLGEVVGIDPCKSPPCVVVVVAVEPLRHVDIGGGSASGVGAVGRAGLLLSNESRHDFDILSRALRQPPPGRVRRNRLAVDHCLVEAAYAPLALRSGYRVDRGGLPKREGEDHLGHVAEAVGGVASGEVAHGSQAVGCVPPSGRVPDSCCTIVPDLEGGEGHLGPLCG